MKLKIVFLCMVLILLASIVNASEKSISIGGHTFTADLDDTWSTDSAKVTTYNPEDMLGGPDQKNIASGAHDWTGYTVGMAFAHLEKLSSSGKLTAESEYGDSSIYVLNPMKSYIETYNPTESDILKHATDLIINPNDLSGKELESLSEKDIEYNGKPAHLVETDTTVSLGVIAFFLDNNKVGIISAGTNKFGGMRAWDVIKSITVTASTSKAFGVQGNLVDRNFDGLQDVLKMSPESTVMAYWINLIPSQNLTDAATAALPESFGLTYGSQIYSTKVERMAGIYFDKTSLEFHWIPPFKVGYNGLVIPYEGYMMIPAGSEYAMVMGKPVLFGTQDAEKQVIDVIAGGLSAGDFTLVDDHQADLQVEALGRGGASMPLSGGYKEFYLGVSISKDQANGFDLYAKYLQPSESVNQRVQDIAGKNSFSYTTKGTDSELSGFVAPENLPNVLGGLLKP